ncbi:MAG: ATP-binding protein, partial [Bacteroidales bacterium]
KDKFSINGSYIVLMYEDSQRNFWIATNMGLELFDRKKDKFFHYTSDDGLPNNTIQGIQEDGDGNLWLSTNHGISKYIQGTKRTGRDTFRNYNVHDGLPANEFLKRSCFKNNEGYIYFGSIQGYVKFHPDSITDNLVVPPVVITDFQLIGNRDTAKREKSELLWSIHEKKVIHLSYLQADFSIKYAALNYVNPIKNRYRFKLEGYEDDWKDVGNQRSATYTNLAPGKYTFKVMGSNNDFVWNDAPAIVKIIIHPPWWRTLGFIISASIVFVIIVMYLIRLRIMRLKDQKKVLELTVARRTEELSMANKLLQERQEEISKQNEELEKHRHQLEYLVEERTNELQAAKVKAEESDRLKSSFLANMSHEIRTPMNAIVGFSSLLGDSNLEGEDKAKFLEIIKNNSETLLTLINDILDISLIEANQLTMNKEVFDVNAMLSESEKFLLLDNENNLRIQFKPGSKDNVFTIFNDPVRFKQIVNNLLNNALKYTEKGHIIFGYDVEDNFVRFYVSDSGIGMNESDIEFIFNPFYKAENVESKLYRGAGIGLSITKNLVELMGGDIWVESKPDKGTTFYFILPKSESTPTSKKPEPSKKKNFEFEKATILVAEDEDTNYKLVETILSSTKADVIRAKDGAEAVGFVEKHKGIQNLIVLMDIKMPNMNGFEAQRKIKSIRENIPVIAITAYAQATDKSRILIHKFDGYLSKPIYPEELLRIIDNFYSE